MIPVCDIFKTLLAIDNPSRQESELRNHVLGCFQSADTAGLITQTQTDEIGNLFIRVDGTGQGSPMMFCAHMDSVPPCQGIQFVESIHENGEPIIQAAGTTILGADDKSGIATMIAIFQKLAAEGTKPPRTIEFLFTVQEEIGINGAKAFDLAQCESQHVFVLDGEGNLGDIFNAGPARRSIEIAVHGKQAHAMAPDAGVSAIYAALDVMQHLPAFGRITPDSSFNLGRIRGGKARNVIADDAFLEAELRSFSMTELEQFSKQVETACTTTQQKHPGSIITSDIKHQYDPFVIPENAVSVQAAAQACADIRILSTQPLITRMYIGSDAHVLNARGREAIVLGMGFHGSHSVREFIQTRHLEGVFEWVWAMIHRCRQQA